MGWWKNVNELTRRKDKAVVSLDDKFLEQLNRFFGVSMPVRDLEVCILFSSVIKLIKSLKFHRHYYGLIVLNQ